MADAGAWVGSCKDELDPIGDVGAVLHSPGEESGIRTGSVCRSGDSKRSAIAIVPELALPPSALGAEAIDGRVQLGRSGLSGPETEMRASLRVSRASEAARSPWGGDEGVGVMPASRSSKGREARESLRVKG
jgi:hypothetical protein